MKYRVKQKIRCMGINFSAGQILEEGLDNDFIIELLRFKDKYIEIFKEPLQWQETKHIYYFDGKRLDEIVYHNIS